MKKDSLRKIFKYSSTTRANGVVWTWKCPHPGCDRGDSHRYRMIQHAEIHEKELYGELKKVWRRLIDLEKGLSIEESDSKAVEKEQPQMSSAKKPKLATGQRLMDDFCIGNLKDMTMQGLAKLAIEDVMALSVCESPAMREFMDVMMQVSRIATLKGFSVTADQLCLSRKPFTSKVDETCAKLFDDMAESVRNDAIHYGCTLIQDGRSNIRNDPLIATGVQGKGSFVALGTVNAEEKKKDSDYIVGLVKEYLDDNGKGSGFGKFIVALVLDGAAANIKAMRVVNQEQNLIVIRCQAHAFALLIKKILLSCFSDTIRNADKIITFVRSHSRVNSILRKISDGRKVIRFVETRFNTHPVALLRLYQLRNAFSSMLANEDFCSYMDSDANARTVKLFADVKNALIDSTFWENIRVALEICIPITVALRHMDKSTIRSRHVHKLWSALGGHVAKVLQSDSWKSVSQATKRQVYQIYKKSWLDSHYPIMSAAYILDPLNYKEIRTMMLQASEGKCDEWLQYDRDTISCLRTLCKRVFAGDGLQDTTKKVEKLYADYKAKSGSFADISIDEDEDPESWWTSRVNPLGRLAIILINIVCTCSNVERLHKIYSMVHTPERNQLKEERVDRLVKGNLATRMQRVQKMGELQSASEILNSFSGNNSGSSDRSLFTFLNLTPEIQADLEAWASLYIQADVQISQTMNSTEGSPGFAAQTRVIQLEDSGEANSDTLDVTDDVTLEAEIDTDLGVDTESTTEDRTVCLLPADAKFLSSLSESFSIG